MFYQTRKNLIWGEPKYKGHNASTPILVQPTNSRNKEYFNEKPF